MVPHTLSRWFRLCAQRRHDLDLTTWRGRFTERHPLNVPGPYYAAATDTCCLGPALAPHHVLYDAHGVEFVWRQPRNDQEVAALARAGSAEPCLGYGADGDQHWTLPLLRQWWSGLPGLQPLVDAVLAAPLVMGDPDQNALVQASREEWQQYWHSLQLELDVRRYAFRLQHGRDAGDEEDLPPLLL